MKDATRKRFHTELLEGMAQGYGVKSVSQPFSVVTPTVQQRLQDKIVEQSTFLPKINVLTVDEMSGENILGSASGPVSGRTDTRSNGERTPRNMLGLELYGYELKQTNSDVLMRYETMDAWAKFPDMATRYTTFVHKRIACDRELIGWYGTSAAATTDITTNPLLQDVNKGWLQYVRENHPEGILIEGASAEGEIRIGTAADADWANLDVAVNDLLQGIPEYMRDGLVALIGSELIAREKAALYASMAGTPTEKAALAASMTTFGGLQWETPSNFPTRGIVITSYDNLSIYMQDGSWRRKIEDNPKKDQVEDYNSRNEGYVVETPEKFAAVEFANVVFYGEKTWVTATEPTT